MSSVESAVASIAADAVAGEPGVDLDALVEASLSGVDGQAVAADSLAFDSLTYAVGPDGAPVQVAALPDASLSDAGSPASVADSGGPWWQSLSPAGEAVPIEPVSIGDTILDSLGTLKGEGSAILQDVVQTLSGGEPSAGDMLHVQFQLMRFNIELQTTSNMAHHGVEDVKTIMRGQ